MVVAIHQPCYFPYMGIFYKIWQSDSFVFLDDVQYTSGSVFEWNRIKTPQGECRIKVPIERRFGQNLNETRIRCSIKWQEDHLKKLWMNYRRCRYFDEVFAICEAVVESGAETIAELGEISMRALMEYFGIRPKTFKASAWGLSETSQERLIEIVKIVGGDSYFSGVGGKHYQTDEAFQNAGINLIYSDYSPLPYKQLWGDFAPNLSALDFAMNEGRGASEYFIKIKEKANGDRKDDFAAG